MAIISLRAYNREIESLIERGQHEQAIFHCRHILQYFPKHIDTYRLLGKTYLESQRYGDAADILQRVLSSMPDDFVSHVGLSIIREDEGNLNDAIWHMERAFENQPSNSAIQAELRRLRNKRDGYDAPKVRLTRGALARMYMKGDLYPQAIAELRAALAEDPKRIDLQILLGQCYLRVDQRVEAAETCSIILHKLPNALEANRILELILATTERAEEARACRERVQALDPYYAHTSSVRPDTAQVPDEAVVLEKGAWQPGRTSGQLGAQPHWAASLGVKVDDIAPAQQAVPDWLSETGAPAEPVAAPEQEPEEELAPPSEQTEDYIPDWLKDAGWVPGGSQEEQPEAPGELPAELADMPAVQAEIPDWLQAIAPESEAGDIPSSGELVGELEDMDWSGLQESSAADEPVDQTQPEAELDLGDVQAPIDVPDWLSELGSEPTAPPPSPVAGSEPGEDVPDWLAELSPEDQVGQEFPGVPESETSEDIEPAALPEWLKDMEAPESEVEPAAPDGEIEVLASKEEEWSFELEEPSAGEAAPEQAAELPDWLDEISPAGAAEPAFEPVGEEKGEETSELEALPVEELPDWMKEIEQEYEMAGPTGDNDSEESATGTPGDAEPVQALPAQEVEQGVAPFSTEDGEDDAFAWLESLAAKQGAREEELLLSPDQRQETPPEWVTESDDEERQTEVFQSAAASSGVTAHLDLPDAEGEDSGGEEIPEWLKEFQAEPEDKISPAIEDTAPAQSSPAFTEEELEMELATPGGVEEAGDEEEPGADWLSELEAEIEAETPESRGAEETVAEIPAEDAELPEWLRETEAEQPPAAQQPIDEAELEAETAELPDWLSEIEAEEEAELPSLGTEPEEEPAHEPGVELPAEAEAADLPDWLRELEAEVLPEETAAESMLEEMSAAPEAVVEGEAEFVPESEAELAELPDWLQETAPEAQPEGASLEWPEEPEIIEGDTQPSTGLLKHLEQISGQSAPSEELPAEEAGELPDWLVEMAEEAELEELPHLETGPAAEVEALELEEVQLEEVSTAEFEEEPETEVAVSELTEAVPDWLTEEAPAIEAEPEEIPAAAFDEEAETAIPELTEAVPEWLTEEVPVTEAEAETPEPAAEVEPLAEESAAPAEYAVDEAETPTAVTPEPEEVGFADEDAAFAWLESLAAKQGAREDELLLEPEERSDRPPDWIKKVLDTGELTPPEPVEPGLPAFIEARAGAIEHETEEELPVPEGPSIEREESVIAVEEGQAPAEAVVDELTAFEQVEEAPLAEEVEEEIETEIEMVERMFQPAAPEAEASEELPELPTWLQDIEEPVQEEEPGWIPPEPAPAPAPVELQAVDLNTASLKELERLPGIGFIRAQALLDYRDVNGPFSRIEELNLVEGFDADTIDGLRDLVHVEAPEPTVEVHPLPVSTVTSEEAQVTLLQARNELVQELHQSALQKYLSLIESEELLDDVIHDLHEVLSRNPKDIDVWQALGDAHLRAGHIQEALNAYHRAEEFLR